MKRFVTVFLVLRICLSCLSAGAWALELPDLSVLDDTVAAVEAAEAEAPAEETVTAEEEAPVLLAVGVAASGIYGDNITWSLSEDGVLTFSGEGSMRNAEAWELLEWKEYADSITKVVVEDGITTVGDYVFSGLVSLVAVSLPESLETIGEGSFRDCSSLTGVDLPDGLRSLGEEVFYSCSALREIEIPKNVTVIPRHAFTDCSSLLSMTVYGGITAELYSCSYAGNIEHLLYIGTEEEWEISRANSGDTTFSGQTPCFGEEGDHASVGENCVCRYVDCDVCGTFKYEKWKTDHIFENGLCSVCGLGYTVQEDGTAMITSLPLEDGKVEIPEFVDRLFGIEVTALAPGLFENCTELTTVIIPYTIKTIGENAFNGCTALEVLEYGGWENEWSLIEIASGNDPLLHAWDLNLYGNINGDSEVNTADLVALMKYLVGTASDVNRHALDVNEDEFVDILDVLRLVNHLANLSWEEENGDILL